MTVQALLDLLDADGIEVFLTPDGEPHAAFTLNAQRCCCPLRHRDFRTYLSDLAFHELGQVPGVHLLSAVRDLFHARVRGGPTREVLPRLGACEKEHFLDLCDGRHVVRIGAAGWTLIDAARVPVCFRRSRGMRPLMPPVPGGHVHELRTLLNLESDEDWTLLLSWLLCALRPTGPYPVLALHGEQGSAKSTTTRMLRALIDPHQAPVRAQPRDVRDLLIAATHSWVVALDNLSRLPEWLSDALCRLSTGGGLSTRALFTDGEEAIWFAQRPIILNGIEDLCTRSDLLDRALVLHLPPISAAQRCREVDLWARFAEAQGRILGALLSAAAGALRRMNEIDEIDEKEAGTPGLPRMADFATWAMAAEGALGAPAGTFLHAYERSRQEAHEMSLEASPIAEGICLLLEEDGQWSGTATELLTAIKDQLEDSVQRQTDFPRSGRALSGQLRRILPDLRAIGIDAVLGQRDPGHGRARLIHLMQKERASAGPSGPSGTVRQGPAQVPAG